MLGETYELVTEDFRWISEQVCHHPPITAYYQEGKNYKLHGFIDTKSSFGFGGGKGLMEIYQKGYQDYYYEKFDESISISRPKVYACNLVLGTLYVDFEGEVKALNNRNGDTAVLNFARRGWASNSSMSGLIYDSEGNEKAKIKGSWWDKITVIDSQTG